MNYVLIGLVVLAIELSGVAFITGCFWIADKMMKSKDCK